MAEFMLHYPNKFILLCALVLFVILVLGVNIIELIKMRIVKNSVEKMVGKLDE